MEDGSKEFVGLMNEGVEDTLKGYLAGVKAVRVDGVIERLERQSEGALALLYGSMGALTHVTGIAKRGSE